ncbi:MAG: TetR/AcrR family transcriptional regulator [Proteobacteria bacterium]|nr:TetR/AcrR family transcriptional regulator [Pseudomonadota bacterium]
MKMNGKREKVDIRKVEILEHFQQVLREEGFEGASIAKIAGKMNVNPSLLIHYFSTKEEMILELVDFIIEKYEKMVLEKTRTIDNSGRRLETMLDTIFGLDWISQVDTGAFYACYYLSFRNAKVKGRMQKMFDRFRHGLTEQIELCLSDGVIEREDSHKIADFIIYLVEGLSFYRNIGGGDRHYLEIGEYLKEKVLRMLRKGEDRVATSSAEDLVRFKKDTKRLIENLQDRVDDLKKKVGDL